MRIDLPYCGFKNCRYCFDGNCMKPSELEKCEYWYLLHEEAYQEDEELLKKILESGDCNDCALLNSQCRYAPGWGKQVRYNCPFYSKGR